MAEDELITDMIPTIADGYVKISEFALTIDGYAAAGSLTRAFDMAKLNRFHSVVDARVCLYMIFGILHNAMKTLEEEPVLYERANAALNHIRQNIREK